jgi:hypothetical protein
MSLHIPNPDYMGSAGIVLGPDIDSEIFTIWGKPRVIYRIGCGRSNLNSIASTRL